MGSDAAFFKLAPDADTDERHLCADSLELLRSAAALVTDAGWAIAHVDATVMIERPALAPHLSHPPEGRRHRRPHP